MKSLRTVLFALLAAAAASPLPAQVIGGKVLDRASGQPVPEVTVEAVATSNNRVVERARTDATGYYVLQLPEAGDYRLRARRVGYQTATTDPVSVDLRETLETEIQIATDQVVLAPLTVRARAQPPRSLTLEREGFYDRERRGFGRFITQHEISSMVVLETSSVFRSIPGVELVPVGGNKFAVAIARGVQKCMPRLVIDDLPAASSDVDNFVRPREIAGIEVYRGGSEVPGRWQGLRNPCGLIVIWTETGARR